MFFLLALFKSKEDRKLSHKTGPIRAKIDLLSEYAVFLLAGVVIALVMANWFPEHYQDLRNFDISKMESVEVEPGHHHGLWTLSALANDSIMALFFLIAGVEVLEAFLPGGPLRSRRVFFSTILATLGGILGPVAVYLVACYASGNLEELGRGWAIPCATDIVFAALAVGLCLGNGHPARAFLLLLAILDDAAGLGIIAIAYPQGTLHPEYLLLVLAGVCAGGIMRKCGVRHWFWHLLVVGCASWWGFHLAGLHAALGLLPALSFIPHAHSDAGLFKRSELKRLDQVSHMKHTLEPIVNIGLFLFGLMNAGVVFSGADSATLIVLSGLVIGKPLGIVLFVWLSDRLFGLKLPAQMHYGHLWLIGLIAGLGFTVALFVSVAAFGATNPAAMNAANIGALLSLSLLGVAWVVAKIARVQKLHPAKAES